MASIPSISQFQNAMQHIREIPIIKKTNLELNRKLSERYGANIYLKREDTQLSRSFKIRGAAHYYTKLTAEEKKKGVIVASDGNFSSACAYAAAHYKVKTQIYVTKLLQASRIEQIQEFGKEYVTIIQEGDYFEQALEAAQKEAKKTGKRLLHPFDDELPIQANGTIAWEILNDKTWDLDYLFVCVGGAGLISGIQIVINELSPDTEIIGVEPENANSLQLSLKSGKVQQVKNLSRFCDGSAVIKVGDKCFDICKKSMKTTDVVCEGDIASAILQLYDCGIIVEPAGALSVAALEQNKDKIKGKNVVCIVSGGNTDLQRLDIFKEIALMHQGLKYFFLINFPLRQGILKDFVKNCLQDSDEISHVQFNKKVNRERAPALIALEVKKKQDIDRIIESMKKMQLHYKIVNQDKELYDLLV